MGFVPYLFFDGRCEEAAAFYQKAVGAENKVMHCTLKIGNSTVMAADDCTGKPRFQGFSLSLAATSAGEAERLFTALGDGGRVTMPLTKTFFAAKFGMLTDRFGMGWMVILDA